MDGPWPVLVKLQNDISERRPMPRCEKNELVFAYYETRMYKILP